MPHYAPYIAHRSGGPDLDLTSDLPLPHLTPAQTLIWHLIYDGLTTKQIASRLNISPYTARWHRKRLYSTLGIHSNIEAVKLHMLTFGMTDAHSKSSK